MRIRTLLLAGLLLKAGTSLWASEPCLMVAGDPVRASDLAAAFPEFARVAPDTPVGAAPAPGLRRILGPVEIARWAARTGVELTRSAMVCLERAQRPLERVYLEAALGRELESSFGSDEPLRWSILNFRPQNAPPGELRFTKAGLNLAGSGQGEEVHCWRGQLIYDEGKHSLAVVVNLRLSRSRESWKATRDLPAGATLADADVARQESWASPVLAPRSAAEGPVVGRRLRRPLTAGKAVSRSDLEPVYAIERGALVTAEVSVGGARLSVPAVAETRAQSGQKVMLRNPESRRSFSGRAQEGGRVRVDPPKPDAAAAGGVR